MDNGKIELGISLNNTCNLRCRMCRIWSQDEGENKLDLETCRRIIDGLDGFQVKGVRLSGGDPLLVPWALELAAHIHKKGYHTVATTNGSMITESFAARIAASGIANLNLSLDAETADVHDGIRGLAGSYQRIARAIDYLSAQPEAVRIGINTVISGMNLDHIVPLAEMAQRDRRIDHIYFMAVMQPFGTPPDKEWFMRDEFRFLWPQAAEKTSTVLSQLVRLKERGYKINNSPAQLRAFARYFLDPLHFTRRNSCNLGREAVEVNQLGEVYLCYHHGSIGNIFEDTLAAIWRSERAARAREAISVCSQNCNLLINCYFEEEDV